MLLMTGQVSSYAAGPVPEATTWTITGPVREIGSVDKYASPGTRLVDAALVDTYQRLQGIRYYVLRGQLFKGRYFYGYTMGHRAGSPVIAEQVGFNSAAHTELVAVGLPGPAASIRIDSVYYGSCPGYMVCGGVHTIWWTPSNNDVSHVCDRMAYNYNASTGTISNFDPINCLVTSNTTFGWYALSGGPFSYTFFHGINYNGTSSASAYVGTIDSFVASFTRAQTYGHMDWPADCETDYNSNEVTGDAHGVIRWVGNTVAFSPDGTMGTNCSSPGNSGFYWTQVSY